ncbi:MAG: hypothetical protein RID42_04550 [Alphaproteobacteria bacterium]
MTYSKHRNPALGSMQQRAALLVDLCEKALDVRLDSMAACAFDTEMVKAILKGVVAHDAELFRIFRSEIAADVLELPYIMVHFHDDRWDEGVWHRDNDDRARSMHWLPLRGRGAAISFLPDLPLDMTRAAARAARAAGIKRVATPRLEPNEYLTWPSTTYHRGILNRERQVRVNYIVTVRPGADPAALVAQTVDLDDAAVGEYCRTAAAALAAVAAREPLGNETIAARFRPLFETSLHALALKEARLGTQAFSAVAKRAA